MNIYFAEKLKSLRAEKKVSQEKLAQYLNVSFQAVSKWERDYYSPNEWNAEKLNELRGCEVHMTHMATPGDEAGLRRLGCRYTSDPYYAVTAIFTARQ